MAAGQLLMFFSASVYTNVDLSHIIMWLGLAVLALGTGFFKPNISSMVGHLYPKGDKRLDSAYTIFYMGINLGAFIGPLVCGGVGNLYDANGQPIPDAFKWGFLAAAIAMVLGTFGFIFLKNKYVVDPEGNGIGIGPNKNNLKHEDALPRETTKTSFVQVGLWSGLGLMFFIVFRYVSGFDWIGAFIFSVAIAVSGLILFDKSLTPSERGRVIVIFISAFFVIFFWAAFEQAGSSLTIFAERNTDRSFLRRYTTGHSRIVHFSHWRFIVLFLATHHGNSFRTEKAFRWSWCTGRIVCYIPLYKRYSLRTERDPCQLVQQRELHVADPYCALPQLSLAIPRQKEYGAFFSQKTILRLVITGSWLPADRLWREG